MSVAAVLLAAGAGSRFDGGTHKLFAVVRGSRLVDMAVGNAGGLDDLIVVEGAVPLGIDGAVRNPRWREGLATSLQVGIAAARSRGHDAVVVAHADQPGIPSSAWLAVAAAASTPIAVARYPDGRRGHPVRLADAVWPLLPKTGDDGAAPLMREQPDLVTEVACEGDPADIDTVEDLRAWS